MTLHDLNDPATALTLLLDACRRPGVTAALRKALPSPAYDLRMVLETLDRYVAAIEADAAPTRGVEVAGRVRAMPLREVVSPAERERRRSLVIAVGTLLYGETWQTPLAKALGEASGRPMNQSRVAQWLHDGVQVRPVPGYVIVALRQVAMEGIARLRRNAATVERMYAGKTDDEVVAPQGGLPASASRW